MIKSILTTTFTALTLVAVPAVAQTASQHKAATARTMSGTQYAKKAAASDLFEIESSRLAVQKSQRADVRDFANEMIRDHGASTEKLMPAAKDATPPISIMPTLEPTQHATMEQLRKLPKGPAFDNAYIKAQLKAHEEALPILRAYAANGSVPSLKAHAAETAPIVGAHLDRVQKLSKGHPK